jgi:2-phospho-L-lactate guanylyltransferase
MLGHTLKTIRDVPEIEHTLIVSRDPAALALAREYGARTLQEDGNPNLNTALRRATLVTQMYASSEVIILPADLPLLKASELQTMISKATNPPVVVISPDRRMNGTNALLVNPGGLIDYGFGIGSFQRHIDRAHKAQARVEICDLPSISIDLDLPEDLELIRQIQAATPSLLSQ